MDNLFDDTIAALATPAGRGGIALVRVSGSDTLCILDTIFDGAIKLAEAGSHTVHFGRIHGADGAVIDEVLVTVFRAPRSYTSEDMAEVGCHGGRAVADEVLRAILGAGARHAERGEFTKRAFLLGRIDLAQAEAVMQMVSAPSGRGVRVAAQQLKGILSDRVNKITDRTVGVTSSVEARLDFPEDIEENYGLEELLSEMDEIIADATALSRTSETGRMIQEGINVAIVGPPNAGKSSLFNRLLANDRAIVSDRPGTTRDFIKETITWRGVALNIIDTAGLTPSEDTLELEGMDRTWRCIEASDVVLLVLDGSVEVRQPPDFLQRLPKDATVIVMNKSDVGECETTIGVLRDEGMTVATYSCVGSSSPAPILDAIYDLYSDMGELGSDLAIVANRRHSELLGKAVKSLSSAREIMSSAGGDELVCFELREALDALEAVTGRNLSMEVVDQVFADFCVGK